MPRMAIPYGWVQYLNKLRVSEWHFRFYQLGERHPLVTRLCNAICYWISKWRISDKRLFLWQEATWPRHQLPVFMPTLCWDIVWIALMITTINDLAVKSGDILNVYFQETSAKKVWTTLGPKFSKNNRKTALIIRVLYGLKLASAAFRSHLSRCCMCPVRLT